MIRIALYISKAGNTMIVENMLITLLHKYTYGARHLGSTFDLTCEQQKNKAITWNYNENIALVITGHHA